MYKSNLVFKSPSKENYFFGYFNKKQLNADNNKLLALRVKKIDSILSFNDYVDVGYFNIDDGIFNVIDSTNAVNWQQGCMLEWLGPDNCNKLIYNKFIDERLVAIIYDIRNNKKEIIDDPVYTVSDDGSFALTIDFERHHFFRRGYSYDFKNPASAKNIPIDHNDGIFVIDLLKNKKEKVIGIDALLNNNPLKTMNGAIHYLEHMAINPTGKRFCFLHRWKLKDGGIYARLYTCDKYGQNLHLISDSGRMSHYSWRNNHQILAYGGKINNINKIRKNKIISNLIIKPLLPFYHKLVHHDSKLSKVVTGDSYLILTDFQNDVTKIANSISHTDGHPSFSRANDNIFITDTYPLNSNGNIAKLILYDLEHDVEFILENLNSIPSYDNTPIRCDLHPRWSINGKFVSIDTMDRGFRSIYLYEISK